MRRIVLAVAYAAAGLAVLHAANESIAQERARERVQQRAQERAGSREIIPGSELMTPAERDAYRRRYAAAKSEEERSEVRARHVTAMQERARLRGLRLAPDPAAQREGK